MQLIMMKGEHAMSYYFSKIVNVSFDEAIDPVASMAAVNNPNLRIIAEQVRAKLKRVIDNL